MKNLAGVVTCDEDIRLELTRARIEIAEGSKPNPGEVPYTVVGVLGPIMFRRAWRYWVAEGRVPIAVARVLYADPVGRTDVRVDGNCGCPDPDAGPWATHYDAEGREIAWNPGGVELAACLRLVDKGLMLREHVDRYAWAEDPRAVAVTSSVNVYHIDSEVGLRLFADAIRGLMQKETP